MNAPTSSLEALEIHWRAYHHLVGGYPPEIDGETVPGRIIISGVDENGRPTLEIMM